MLRVVALIFSALVTSAAFAHQGPVTSEEFDLIRKAKVLVIVPQERIEASFTESNIGKDYGLIGLTIDALGNNAAFKKLKENLRPVQAATTDLDFRRDFIAQLKSAGIFDPARIEVIEKAPESKSERLELVAGADDPVVLLDATYLFTTLTHRTLTTNLALTLWSGGKKKPLHENAVTYISVPVTLTQAWDIGPMTLPLWAQDNARRYRAAYAEGIAGSIDLLVKVKTFAPPAGSKSEERIDYSDVALKITQRGHIVEETSERVVLFDNGTMTSLPIVPTFAAREADIRPVKATHGRVYFYRPGPADTWFIEPSFYANDRKLGELYLNTYSSIDLPPGKYSFRVKYDGDAPGASVARGQINKIIPVDVEVRAGEEHFVRYDGYKGIWTKEDVLKHVEGAAALPALKPLWPVFW